MAQGTIQYKPNQSMFDNLTGSDILVNPVNKVGVMGAGLAKEFKERYPQYYDDYKRMCNNNNFSACAHSFIKYNEEFISFATKTHWKDPSSLELVKSGLSRMPKVLNRLENHYVHIPMLGCGLGGLEWSEVQPLIHGMAESNLHLASFIIYGVEL